MVKHEARRALKMITITDDRAPREPIVVSLTAEERYMTCIALLVILSNRWLISAATAEQFEYDAIESILSRVLET